MSTDYTLVIGNKNYSSWSMRPWVWMRHHNIAFKEHRIPLYTPETAPKIAEYGCGSTVPILVDGSIKVWDSLSILEYLAEKHPGCATWPAAVGARAHARSVSAEMHSGFMAVRSAMPMNCRRVVDDFSISDEVQKNIDRINKLFNECRRLYSGDGEWLYGEYSIADAMFTPVVMRFNSYGVTLNGDAAEYLKTVTSQPAVVEWIADSHKVTVVIENEEA